MSIETQPFGLSEMGDHVSSSEVIASNDLLQAQKPAEERQYSFEKLPIGENWYSVELSAQDVLGLQGFVETSGSVDDAYHFWLEHHVVTLEDIVKVANNSSENYWTPNENKPEKYPAVLIFLENFNGDRILNKGALLNMGNILDGNHRLAKEAAKIMNMSEEERLNYRYPAYVANISPLLATYCNLYYFVEPIINSTRKVLGKTVADIDPRNVMSIPDKFRLLSQRLRN